MSKAIFPDDMPEARNTFLILKIAAMAGDSGLIAQQVLYPIDVMLNGVPATIASPEEFERHYDGIFTRPFLDTLAAGNEDELELLLDGVRAADGALRFNQFCMDSACTEAQFLITEIHN